VNFTLADGGSFNIFASDTSNNLFAAGSSFTLTVGFSDGTTATASFTIPTPPPTNISLNYNGKLRDRVGQGETALTGDGSLDGTFTVTLQAGSGNRTVTSLDLRRSANSGIWDTTPNNGYWVSGAASSLDAPLLNASNGTVNFTLADGGSFNIFASDTSNNLFAVGSSFTLTVTFSDGTMASANTTIFSSPPPSNPPSITLAYLGKIRDRVGQGETALTADGFLDGTFTVTLQAGSGNRTVTSLDLRRSANTGIWDTIPNNGYWVSGAASSLDAPLLNASNGTVNFTLAEGAGFNIFASDASSNPFAPGSSFTLTIGFSDGTNAIASATAP
jgi:hypothetical protein